MRTTLSVPGIAGGTAVIDEGDVLVEQWVAEELGNSSHLVADRLTGEVAVIDPVRDVDRYVEAVAARGWRVTSSLDTHVHNDFLSGGPDLRAATGSAFVVPGGSGIQGADRQLEGGEDVAVGPLRLRAVRSPGHTPEHLSYLLLGPGEETLALFSGGALMVGTIARPDLLGASRLFELSRQAHEALHARILRLPDALRVLPTHGGGSFCGAASSTERETTIGRERRHNPMATAPDFASFLAVHAKQGRYPAYYARMAPLNRAGMAGHAALGVQPLSVAGFDRVVAAGAAVVDCRPHDEFDAGHVPGSYAVPVDGSFSAWVGWVLDIDTPLALVASSTVDAEDAIRQLVRVGFCRVTGWLDPALWRGADRAMRGVASCTMADVAARVLEGGRITVLDVRPESEWAAGHLPGAVHAMAPDIRAMSDSLDRTAPVAVHCATGYRSALGVSLLLQDGFTHIWHVTDGVDAWSAMGHPLVTAV